MTLTNFEITAKLLILRENRFRSIDTSRDVDSDGKKKKFLA